MFSALMNIVDNVKMSLLFLDFKKQFFVVVAMFKKMFLPLLQVVKDCDFIDKEKTSCLD
jgi:hypothetical protein